MGEKFELERFEWQAPDRLAISGTFHGLEQSPGDTPVLVVSGDGEAHHLRSVDESVSGPPEDGESWQAQFEWAEAPVGIETAVLEFGTRMVIELPAPGAKRRSRFIEVRRADDGAAPADEGPAPADEEAVLADDGAAPADEPPVAATGDIGLQADLVAAEARIQELHAALERAEADRDHARADLDAERAGRAQDAEQFHAGLARVRASAEQALDEQRQRVSALEAAGADASEMRADAQQLLDRLTRLAEAFDAGR